MTIVLLTVAELDEMLPDTCQLRWLNGWGVCDEVGFHKPDDWYGANWIFEGLKRDQGADARAKMLIYLLENSLIELPKKTPEKLSA